MCSSLPTCELIPYTGSRKLDRPVEDSPDRLSLALEPEAAGLFCQTREERHFKPKHFTVLDIGGGTVDITSYRIDDNDHLCVIGKASGSGSGGTCVNEKFAEFLETIVDDKAFMQYKTVSNPQLQQQHMADLNKLIYGNFEEQKTIFGDEENDQKRVPAVINIPNSFLKFYKAEELAERISKLYTDDDVELEGSELIVEPAKMRNFFEPAVDRICECAFNALDNIKEEVEKLEAIYLVGGFGGCKFVKRIIEEKLQSRYSPKLQVFVPIEHKVAVVCGAIIFRHNPKLIWSRKAEATYGDDVLIGFNDNIHDTAYKVTNEDGVDYCNDLFRSFTEVGDTICANEVLQNSIIPFSRKQTNMVFTVYSSNKRDIFYIRDRAHNLVAGVKKIGKMVFDLQGIPGETKYEKRVILTIDLSQTEIQLKGHHEKTGKAVKVVLDTL